MLWDRKREQKQEFEKKLGDLGRKLEDFDGELDDVGTSLTESSSELRSLRQELTQEGRKVREAVSTGTMVLREENRELRRRQERMLADLKALHLEIRSALAGVRPAPEPASFETDGAAEGHEAGDGEGEESAENGEASAETETEAVGGPPPRTPGEVSGEQDDRQRQEGHVQQQEQDGARRESGGSAAHGVPEPDTPAVPTAPVDGGEAAVRTPRRTPEEDVRAVKEAAERAALHHPHDSHGPRGSHGDAVTSPRSGGPGFRIPQHTPSWYAQRSEQAHQDERDPRVAHGKLLLIAARASRAELLCHRDTWEFLLAQVAGHPRFRVPSVVEDAQDGRVRTALSGPSLIAVLITLWDIRNAPSRTLDANWALAVTLYERIRTELTGVRPGTDRRTARIALDDGTGRDDAAEAADTSPASDSEPDAA